MTNKVMENAVGMVGKSAVWIGGPIAAQVQIVGVKCAYGHINYQVRDCRGRETWVRSENLQVEGEAI